MSLKEMNQEELKEEALHCIEMISRYSYFENLKLVKVKKKEKMQNRLENIIKICKSKGYKI